MFAIAGGPRLDIERGKSPRAIFPTIAYNYQLDL